MTEPVFAMPLYPVFHDLKGKPLDAGYIYIGTSGQNAEASPRQVFWDAAMQIPAAQPIRTVSGYPSRNGSAASIYTADDYSITVRAKDRTLVYTALTGVNLAAAATERAQAILDEIEALAQSATNYEFVATAGQMVFTGTDAAGNLLDLASVHRVEVAGVAIPPSEYTKSTDGLTLTLVGDIDVLTGDKVVIGGMGAAASTDEIQYPEITTPYTVQPNAHRWDLLSFLGAKAEVAKSIATQDWSEVLEVALQSGEKVNIGARVWPIRQALYADKGVSVEDVPVDVEASSDARMTFYGIDFEGGYFDLRSANEASATNRWKPRWHGGIFDCSNLSTALVYGISVFDVFHATDLDFAGMSFLGWNNTMSLGTVDTGITLHNCPNFSIRNVFGSGMTDNLLYLSGDNTSGPFNLYADGGLVDGITSWRCNNMVALKRWHRGAVIKNFRAIEGNNGILSSPADGSTTNHGHSAQISNGYMLRMSGRPIQITGGVDTKISEVVIEDYGCTLADPTIPTAVADDNQIAGIDLRATVDSAVTGCTIRQNAWAGSTQADADKLITGIRLGRYSTSGSVYSTGCVIKENKIIGAHRGILEDAGCSYNLIEDNQVTLPSSGTVAASAVLGTGTVNKPAEKMYTLTNDPTSVAAGGELVVTITAADVKKGDIVFAWLGNRQAGDTGVNALDMKALCANGQIDLVLTNNAAASADLGNTVFNALARPTI